jgi:YHS domain-containing protein
MKWLFTFAALLLLALTGCETTSANLAKGTGKTAPCEVCRYHHDLACLNVDVDESTPTTVYNGTTYYFCSDSCKTAFIKQPTKYLTFGKK